MDDATGGVLTDIAALAWLALLLGALAYGWVRLRRPTLAWNWGGQVSARPYNLFDAAVIITVVSVLIVAGLQRPEAATADAAPPTLSAEPILVNMVFFLILCAGLMAYLARIRALDPGDLFGLRRIGFWKAFAIAFAFMVPVTIGVNALGYVIREWMNQFWPDPAQQEMVEAFRNSDDLTTKGMMVLAAAVVAPLAEEVVFRGFLYGVIKRYTDTYFAALCSSLLFAVVHLHVGSLLPLVALALAFCAAYEITGSLLVPIWMHAIFNGTSFVVMTFYKDVS